MRQSRAAPVGLDCFASLAMADPTGHCTRPLRAAWRPAAGSRSSRAAPVAPHCGEGCLRAGDGSLTALKPLAGPVHGLVSHDALATAVPQKAATAAGAVDSGSGQHRKSHWRSEFLTFRPMKSVRDVSDATRVTRVSVTAAE
jgi:hypothetical protein